MTALVNFYNSIRRNDEGQDLLEYALLVALIAIVAVGAVTTAGTDRRDDLREHRGGDLATDRDTPATGPACPDSTDNTTHRTNTQPLRRHQEERRP